MSTIVTRAAKGSALTHNEVDANFVNLNNDKIQSGNTVAALTITSATINGGTISGITDLAIADGGTGASNASTARTNLGAQETLVSGTNIKTINSTSILGSGDIAITASVSDGDKGDITVSASGATWTIDSGAVTPTKVLSGTYAIDISGNAATVTNGLYTNVDQTITVNKSFNASNSGIATATGSLNTLQVYGTGGAAMMTFHRPGAYASYFGLDSDNVWKIGGWSAGAVAYPMLYPTSTNAPGTAPVYGCRAWVNFNGTGTVAIRASGNVTSITDLGVGSYKVNFTNAMPDANYSAVCSSDVWFSGTTSFLTGSANIANNTGAGAAVDATTLSLAILR